MLVCCWPRKRRRRVEGRRRIGCGLEFGLELGREVVVVRLILVAVVVVVAGAGAGGGMRRS